MALILGIDIGTTPTIGILIDSEGHTLAPAQRPADSNRPGWAEEEPSPWWENCCALVPEILAKAGRRPSDIAALGVTGMLPAVVLPSIASCRSDGNVKSCVSGRRGWRGPNCGSRA